MANQREYKIIIQGIEESIKNIGTLKDALDSLNTTVDSANKVQSQRKSVIDESAKAEAAYEKQLDRLEKFDAQYAEDLATVKAAIKAKNDEAKYTAIINNSAEGSYNSLSAQYSLIKMQLNAMSEEERKNTQEGREMEQQAKAIHDQMKSLQEATGNASLNVGNYTESINKSDAAQQSMRSTLRELQEEMARMLADGVSKTDAGFQELAKRAGEVKDAMGDANDAIAHYASDTRGIDNVINLATTATAAFETYQGVMVMFGASEEEASQKTAELMGTLSTLNGIQEVYNSLTAQGSASAKILSTLWNAMNPVLDKMGLNLKTVTTTQQTMTVAQKAGTIATKAFSMALKAIPLMLVISLITTLVVHWQDLCNWVNRTFPAVQKFGGVLNMLKGVVKGVGSAIVNWLTNPIKTFAKVIQKVISGDFVGAAKEAVEGVKSQFKGTGEAFSKAFNEQIDLGKAEQASKKVLDTTEKTMNRLKAEGKQGTKEYEHQLQKRLTAFKKGTKEYEEAENELISWRTQQRQKEESAVKQHSANLTEIHKSGIDERKKLEEEHNKWIQKVNENTQSSVVASQNALYKTLNKIAKEYVDQYKNGPLEDYVQAVEDMANTQRINTMLTNFQNMFKEIGNSAELLAKDTKLPDIAKKAASELERLTKDFYRAEGEFNNSFFQELETTMIEYHTKLAEEDPLSKEYADILSEEKAAIQALIINFIGQGTDFGKQVADAMNEQLAILNKYKNTTPEIKEIINALQGQFFAINAKMNDEQYDIFQGIRKGAAEVNKNTMKIIKDTLDQSAKIVDNFIEEHTKDGKIVKDIWGNVTEENAKEWQEKWEIIAKLDELNIQQLESDWNSYLDDVKKIYGKDSDEYLKVLEEKKKAEKKFQEWRALFARNTQKDKNGKPISDSYSGGTSDYNADGKDDQKHKKTFKDIWDTSKDLGERLEESYQLIEENILSPFYDTYSMYLDFAMEETEDKLDEISELYDNMTDKVSESADRIDSIKDDMKDADASQSETLKQQLADEQILYAQRKSQEQRYLKEKEALERKQRRLEKQQRKADLMTGIAQAIANTALGATKTLSAYAYPLGPILAALTIAFGTAQVGLMSAQLAKMKDGGILKLADGGLVSGPLHSQGGVPVTHNGKSTGYEIEGGEFVVNRRSTKKHFDLLNRLNAEGNGGKRVTADGQIRRYASGGMLNIKQADDNLRANNRTNQILSALNGIDMHPQVAVTDIRRVEKNLVRVEQLSGRR